MERLLAYEGPVVHVDHSHRAPAPTGLEWRDCDEELKKEKRECNEHIQGVHANYTNKQQWMENRIVELKQALLDKNNKLQEERQHKETAQKKHKAVSEMLVNEEDVRMKAQEALARCEEALQAKEQELARARETKQAAINRLADDLSDEGAENRKLAAEVAALESENMALKMEAVVDNRNYMEMIRGTDSSALPRFLAVHAMKHSRATKPPVDRNARAFILWIQKKMVEEIGLDEAAAKKRVSKDEWVV